MESTGTHEIEIEITEYNPVRDDDEVVHEFDFEGTFEDGVKQVVWEIEDTHLRGTMLVDGEDRYLVSVVRGEVVVTRLLTW